MKLSALFVTCLLLCPIAVGSQTAGTTAIPIEKEPHHSLIFQNNRVSVFHLHLQPNEVTETHRHASFYAYFSLQPVTISNEVRGHAPVITQLQPGEVRTSKGGFNVAERNTSGEPADIFVVQPVEPTGNGFSAPLAIPMHNAGIVEGYTGSNIRVYSVAIAAGGHLGQRIEAYDSLVIAAADLNIREIVSGLQPADWNMKLGETRWIPKGTTHSETNVGSATATLEVIEFN